MRNWSRVALATGLLAIAVGLSACSSGSNHPSSSGSGGTAVAAPNLSDGSSADDSTPATDAPSPSTAPNPPTPTTKVLPPPSTKTFPPVPVPDSGSGVVGRVTVTGDCPVQADQPCDDKPYATHITVTKQGSNTTLESTSSGTDGAYRLDLAAGSYVLHVTTPPGSPVPMPVSVPVTVEASNWAVQNVKLQGPRSN